MKERVLIAVGLLILANSILRGRIKTLRNRRRLLLQMNTTTLHVLWDFGQAFFKRTKDKSVKGIFVIFAKIDKMFISCWFYSSSIKVPNCFLTNWVKIQILLEDVEIGFTLSSQFNKLCNSIINIKRLHVISIKYFNFFNLSRKASLPPLHLFWLALSAPSQGIWSMVQAHWILWMHWS